MPSLRTWPGKLSSLSFGDNIAALHTIVPLPPSAAASVSPNSTKASSSVRNQKRYWLTCIILPNSFWVWSTVRDVLLVTEDFTACGFSPSSRISSFWRILSTLKGPTTFQLKLRYIYLFSYIRPLSVGYRHDTLNCNCVLFVHIYIFIHHICLCINLGPTWEKKEICHDSERSERG